jgi:thymidylate synthase
MNKILSKEEFLEKLKTDKEFNDEFGNKGIDQISELIKQLKDTPDSRRMVVNAWSVHDLPNMVLPPCHYGFQVYTRELSWYERAEIDGFMEGTKEALRESYIYKSNFKGHRFYGIFNDTDTIEEIFDKLNIPTRAISLMWNQRSCDFPLGIPFNIASYGLLLEIIAKEVNMVPDELIGNLGDCHIYLNQIEGCKEQIGRKYTHEERTELLKQSMGDENYNKAVSELVPFGGGMSEYYDLYKIPTHTREPFPLPSVTITERNWYQHQLVKEHLGEKTFSEKILLLRPDCFELINYQSHPKIKAPLSN